MKQDDSPESQETKGTENRNETPPSDQQNRSNTETISNAAIAAKEEQLEKRIARGEWLMIILTGAIAFSGLCSVAVGVLQWLAISGQLEEMRSSSKQTDKLIAAMQTQAENTGKVAQAAIDQVEQLKASVKVTQETATATTRAAKTAEDTLYLTERADVDILSFKCNPQPISMKTELAIVFRNFGRATANDFRAVWHIGNINQPTQVITEPSVGLIGAGGTRDTTGLSIGEIPQINIDRVIDGTQALFAWGTATYSDATSRSRFEFESAYIPKTACDFRVIKMVNHREQNKNK